MARIILIAHPVRGRLYPLLAIGQSLKERGHRVTVIEYPELSGIAEKLGLEYLSPALPQSWSKFDSPNPSSPFHKIVPKLIKRLQGTALDPQVHSLLEYLRTFESYYDPWTGRDLDFLQPALEEANCDLLLVSDTSFCWLQFFVKDGFSVFWNPHIWSDKTGLRGWSVVWPVWSVVSSVV